MGDRANVVITGYDHNDKVYLYSHWYGEELFRMVQQALDLPEARARWSDPSYLRRIVFQWILDRAGFGETGFGISAEEHDANHPLLILDTQNQFVQFAGSSKMWTFDEFTKATL